MSLADEIQKRAESIERRCAEVERLLGDPAVASDPDQLRTLGREFSEISPLALNVRALREAAGEARSLDESLETETDPDMRRLYEDERLAQRTRAADLEEKIAQELSRDEADADRPVIIEIRAGAGGNEAALFVADLFRAYTRFAENSRWKTEVLSDSPTALGGFKEIAFSLRGPGANARLRHESGVHRVQRIPVTESGGRIHTSTVTVAVLVEPDEVEVRIDPSELRIDTFRASGAGGQHVNKTESAIRITHIPSGLVVECQDERSQQKNRIRGMRVLRARLLQKIQDEQHALIAAERRSQVGTGDRSERIRTYNFPQNRITDHRVGVTLHKLAAVLEGDLEELLSTVGEQIREKKFSTESIEDDD